MKRFSDIVRFIRYDMWRMTAMEMDSPAKRIGYGIIRTIVLVARGFGSKNLNDQAKAFTYSLIFAIVPILAMVMAVAKGFGVVSFIEEDDQKVLWLGTSAGIIRMGPSRDARNVQIYGFSQAANFYRLQRSSCTHGYGFVLFGGNGGIFKLKFTRFTCRTHAREG